MIDYTTLEAVKLAHRIDHDDDDTHLELLIKAASRQVSDYLKTPDGEQPEALEYLREDIQLATIMLVGFLYANSDADPEKAFDPGYLPAPVQSLLYPLRTPTAV
jgi:uncharacterized phage protein (predicted DNA packaging)